MNTLRTWLRRWLGVEDLAEASAAHDQEIGALAETLVEVNRKTDVVGREVADAAGREAKLPRDRRLTRRRLALAGVDIHGLNRGGSRND